MPGHFPDVPLLSVADGRARLADEASRQGEPADGGVRTVSARMPAGSSAEAAEGLEFEAVYAEHFPFVWRTVRRLGVVASAVDDVVQEIFLIVHRRLAEFEARASLRTWLFAIVRRVVSAHRRTLKRKPAQLGGQGAVEADLDAIGDAGERGPHERVAEREAVRVLYAILDELDDEKREIFVLAELEQMSVPEIAEAMEMNVNTVYSRLRAARHDFEAGVARHRARGDFRAAQTRAR